MNNGRRSLLRSLGLFGGFMFLAPRETWACRILRRCRRTMVRTVVVPEGVYASDSSYRHIWPPCTTPTSPQPTSSNLKDLTIDRGGNPIDIVVSGTYTDLNPSNYIVTLNDLNMNGSWPTQQASSVTASELRVDQASVGLGTYGGTEGSIQITIKYSAGRCQAVLYPTADNGGSIVYAS